MSGGLEWRPFGAATYGNRNTGRQLVDSGEELGVKQAAARAILRAMGQKASARAIRRAVAAAAGHLPVPQQKKNAEAAVNGRFFIGVLSGAVLVSGAFVVGSVMFPTDDAKPPVEIANAPEAPEAVTAPAPVPAPEPVVEPEPEPAPAPVEPGRAPVSSRARACSGTSEPAPPSQSPRLSPRRRRTRSRAGTAEACACRYRTPAEACTNGRACCACRCRGARARCEGRSGQPTRLPRHPQPTPPQASGPAPTVAEAPAEPPVAPAATEPDRRGSAGKPSACRSRRRPRSLPLP